MSARGLVRRADKWMASSDAWRLLEQATVGRVATVDEDGWPTVTPVLFAVIDRRICFHHVRQGGLLNANLARDPRVCFEADEPGEVVAGPDPGCSSSFTYRSVVAYGRAEVVEDEADRADVCGALMRKYVDAWPGDPQDFGGRMGGIAVYAIAIDVLTGKHA